MTRADDLAEQLKESILEKLGPEAEKTFFDEKKPPKNPLKRAQWVKETIHKLDTYTDEETRTEIMHKNGVNCANHNQRIIKSAINRRAKYKTLDAFLEAEMKKPPTGTSLEKEGESYILCYLPQQLSRPMRCFCELVNSLPMDETISLTYCQCSVAFVETWWSGIIGKQVKVELIESA